MTSDELKHYARQLGADLCGIASIDRFDDAPEGFHPRDVMPACRSVISFACRFPVGALACTSPVPYTRIRNSITPKMDQIALDVCIHLDGEGYLAAPSPPTRACGTSAPGAGAPSYRRSMPRRPPGWGPSGGTRCSSRRSTAAWSGWAVC